MYAVSVAMPETSYFYYCTLKEIEKFCHFKTKVNIPKKKCGIYPFKTLKKHNYGVFWRFNFLLRQERPIFAGVFHSIRFKVNINKIGVTEVTLFSYSFADYESCYVKIRREKSLFEV